MRLTFPSNLTTTNRKFSYALFSISTVDIDKLALTFEKNLRLSIGEKNRSHLLFEEI